MALNSQISAFKSQMANGGVRPNQFEVRLAFPFPVNGTPNDLSRTTSFLCSAASLPGSHIEPTVLTYRGRDVTLAGERTFEPWTVQIINDDFTIRDSFERWMEQINSNTSNTGLLAPRNYQSDLRVAQLDRNNTVLKVYDFIDAWPIDMSPIELSWDDNNTVEKFNVTFNYQYWVTNTTGGGIPGFGGPGVTGGVAANIGLNGVVGLAGGLGINI